MTKIRSIPCSKRAVLEDLLDLRSASDALPAYYALEHPCERISLYGSYSQGALLNGFTAIAQTGLDLFKPLVVPFVLKPERLRAMLETSLEAGRSYLLHLPVEQRGDVETIAELSQVQITEVYRLDPKRFLPVINVLVVEKETPYGLPRYEIQSAHSHRTASGLNWMSSRFGEIYLEFDPEAQSRGLTKSVLAAISKRLLQERKTPIYRVPDGAPKLREEAIELGFIATGTRHLMASVRLVDPEGSEGED